jgi:Trk-type K+ transport system membrane component
MPLTPKISVEKPFKVLRYVQLALSLWGVVYWIQHGAFVPESETNVHLELNFYRGILTLHFFLGLHGFVALLQKKYSWRRWSKEIIWRLALLYLVIFPHWGLSEWFASDYVFIFGYVFLIKFLIVMAFIADLSVVDLHYTRKNLPPPVIFVASFGLIFFVGAFLLMAPRSTHNGISFIDALFTSVSAVCVTGLAVVDTGTCFTVFGQSVLMALIQVGGLGILTFASYFSYLFKGGASYENQLALSDINSSDRISDVFKTLRYILGITLVVEGLSAIAIYFSVNPADFHSWNDRLFFSVFHAVSAFCNAGFSTLSGNVYTGSFAFNYGFQLIIVATLVFGGLGFPIVSNVVEYVKYWLRKSIVNRTEGRHKPWVFNINSRINLITTLLLIFFGTLLFYHFESETTLVGHTGFGKWVVALFEATTPRTAGFNNVDMTKLTLPTILITIGFMWIGASPAGTGGGIKTSTLAIMILNVFSMAKGKDRIEIYRREISNNSVRRAFAAVYLSLLIIFLGILSITVLEPQLHTRDVAFEVVSAFGTVGLSLGITALLGYKAKIVIMVIMFIGRVGMLTLFVAFIKKTKEKSYRYPKEDININ